MRAAPARLKQCYFCPEKPRDTYILSSTTPQQLASGGAVATKARHLVPLCARHHRILEVAGEHGRVYSNTGVRWWLGVQ